jgi:hypothetical protein
MYFHYGEFRDLGKRDFGKTFWCGAFAAAFFVQSIKTKGRKRRTPN